ncbi:hypothetical protein [Rhodopila sp.]|uniref:hypothetical protein n=1 Tax=Rhodopila sp. TaxID=2480087 RepID=UPI003D133E3A
MQTITAVVLLVMLYGSAHAGFDQSASGRIVLAQATSTDNAHTPVTPNAPSPSRPGQLQQLSQGGYGVTTGGTSHYQTLQTPGGGGALAVPNGAGSSNVIGSQGRAGTVTSPR